MHMHYTAAEIHLASLLMHTQTKGQRIFKLLIYERRVAQTYALHMTFLLKIISRVEHLFYFTLSVSALLSTTGMFSSILLLSDASCGDVPFPTPRSLEVTHNFLSGVCAHIGCKITFHVKIPAKLCSHMQGHTDSEQATFHPSLQINKP